MFASQTTKELKFGDDTVVIGKLSALRLEEAQLVRMKTVAPLLANMPARETPQEAPQEGLAREVRYATFDRQTVLRHGIRSWSVSAKVTPEQVEDLDEPTSDALFKAILDLTFEGSDSRKKD